MIASKKSASESIKSLFHLSPSIPLCTGCAGRMIFVALLAFSASFEALLETNHQVSSGFASTVWGLRWHNVFVWGFSFLVTNSCDAFAGSDGRI